SVLILLHVHHDPHLRDLHPFPTRRSSDLFISLIVLLSVGVGLYITIGDSDTTNVTASWDGMLLEQSSLPSPTRYVLEFNGASLRSEEHTSELQSRENLVCRLLLDKKKEHI